MPNLISNRRCACAQPRTPAAVVLLVTVLLFSAAEIRVSAQTAGARSPEYNDPLAVGAVDLRGYGTVLASITPDRSEFTCESDAKADILLGKLLADLFWDAGSGHAVKTVSIGGRDVVVHEWLPYGDVIVWRNKHRVLVIGGSDEQEAAERAGKEPLLTTSDALFAPSKPYPMYLDYYDLRAVKCGSKGFHPADKFRYLEGAAFVQKFFPGGVCNGARFGVSSADGIDPALSLLDADYNVEQRYGIMDSVSVSTGTWPDWARNTWPTYVEQPGPIRLITPIRYGAYESYGLSDEQRRQSSLKYLHDVMTRYVNNPLTGGYEFYCGDNIFETCFYRWFNGHIGYSPVGIADYRRWLREDRGYSLADLGTRWYGDPNHFKDWSEVTLQDPDEFFGDYNADCLPIRDSWKWKRFDPAQTAPPADDAPGWAPAPSPPNQQMAALPRGSSYWRTSFDAANWLQKNSGKDDYLVFNVDNGWWHGTEVWLNGVDLGVQKSTASPFFGPFAIKVTGLIHSGANNLCFVVNGAVNGEGGPVGPVFLTTTLPRAYPYLGKFRNAQWVDMLEWRLGALNFKVEDTANYARSIDPDRPMLICATDVEVKDGQGETLRKYGGSMEDTGYEASFRPFNSRMGYADGFYGSCEPSGTANLDDPDPTAFITVANRRLGWTLFNGEGMYKELDDSYRYLDLENKTGWFTKNQRLYQLIGKFLPEKPHIAILSSSQNALLGDEFHSANWDIGRGELEASHYDNVYVTETMLKEGLADDYPVLFDTDNMIMDQPTIDAIRRYVEQGGTFVALQNTGRHALLVPDAWPISALTGFKVQGVAKSGIIRFEQNLPIFKGWEGKEFQGEGSQLDWMGDESAKDVSIGLEPVAPDAIPLARWADGTVAVGMNKLGKGKVIVLGSTFWRYGKDVGGTGMLRSSDVEPAFLQSLFTDLGVRRTADASTPDVYARKVITKNGLQEWLIAINTTNAVATADVGFATASQPDAVWDVVGNTPVPFTYVNGWVWIKGTTIAPYGTRIYGIKRGLLSEGVDFWWQEKTKFWTRRADVPPLTETATAVAEPPKSISFSDWKFYADRDGSVANANAWLQPTYNDGSWRSANNTPWNLQFDDLKDYAGVGLYRSLPFAIPASWAAKRISITLSGMAGYCWSSFDLYVNGQKIDGIPAFRQTVDVTDNLKPNDNVVCIKLTGKPTGGDYPVSGLLGCALWIQPDTTLTPSLSLLGEWSAVHGDWSTSTPVSISGVDPAATAGLAQGAGHPVTANHLVRDIDIPADWKGRTISLELFTPPLKRQTPPVTGLANGTLLVNGKVLFLSRLVDDTLNVTPYIEFGRTNRIELWPADSWDGSMSDDNIVVGSIAVGCAADASK